LCEGFIAKEGEKLMPKTHDLDLSIEEQRKHVKELRFKALSEEAFQFRWNEHGVETYEYSASDWMAKFAEFHAERDLEIKRKQIVAEAEAVNRPEPAALIKAERERVANELEQLVWKVNNDERHESYPDPCLVCDSNDWFYEIVTKLREAENE
jgi:hypothetical protein